MSERNFWERTRTQTAFDAVPTSVVENNRRAIVYQPGLKKKKEDEDETVSPPRLFPPFPVQIAFWGFVWGIAENLIFTTSIRAISRIEFVVKVRNCAKPPNTNILSSG